MLSFEMACERFGVLLGRQCRQGQVARARQVAAEIVSRFNLQAGDRRRGKNLGLTRRANDQRSAGEELCAALEA